MKIAELAARMAALQSEIAELDALDEPNEDQTARFAVALDEFDAVKVEHDGEVARQARIDAVRNTAIENPTRIESGDGPASGRSNSGSDPFEGLDQVRAGWVSREDVTARAVSAIEGLRNVPDASRERATVLAEQNAGIARHILLTGSPAYRSAFDKFLRSPQDFHMLLDDRERDAWRTAMSTTVGNGGYMIPFLLDPSIVLTNDGTANPIRQISRIETGTSNKWQGITSAGVTAEWKTEGSAAADASPTVTQPSIPAFLADAYVLGSFEVLEDTNIEAQLPRLIQDAKDRLEATAFTTGNGSTAPKGVVTAVTAVTTSRVTPTTGGTFSAATEVYLVSNALPPRHASKASWLANKTTINRVRQFDTSGGSAFIANLAMGQPPILLGQPLYEASDMTATVTTGSNILLAGDFSEYVIYDRVGTTLEFVPNVFDTSTGRPTGQRGFLAHWRTGADAVNPNAFRVLKL